MLEAIRRLPVSGTHTLPLDELIERLRAPNLGVVPDESAPIGFRLEVGTFPGWESVPTW